MNVHHSSAQFAAVVLHPRQDIQVGVRDYGGTAVYVLEDSRNGSFFRVGKAEYAFFSLLDGTKTIADVLGHCASLLKEAAFSEQEAASFCQWLVQNELASTVEAAMSGRLIESRAEQTAGQTKARLNPMFQKMPLGSPDAVLRSAARFLGGLFSSAGVACWVLLMVVGSFYLLADWQKLSQQSPIRDQSNWIWLAVTALVLKVVHEAAHGIACRREGVHVREWGLMWVLFVPLPYLDVTAATRLDSRYRRFLIAAGGMMAELAIAVVALIVWHHTSDPIVRQHATNVAVTAGFVTVLFNANPLMRFDGYYMLTDLLQMPNLAGHGQMWMRHIGRRIFLGQSSSEQDWPEGRHWLVRCYGMAASVWRVSVSCGMILAADALYFGAGIIVATISLFMILVLPISRMLKTFISVKQHPQLNRKRCFFVSVGLCFAVFVIGRLNWSSDLTAPIVVDYESVTTVRPKSAGFVQTVFVKESQQVQEGDVLLVLKNDDLQVQQRELNEKLRSDRALARIYQEQEDLVAWDGLREKLDAGQKRLDSLTQQIQQLTIRAPKAGIVLTSALDQLTGRFVKRGQPILKMAESADTRIFAMVKQEDASAFADQASFMQVHIWGDDEFKRDAVIQHMRPRATREVIHPALSSLAGGTLPVKTPQVSETNNDKPPKPQLIEPRIVATIKLRATTETLNIGRTGIATVSGTTGTVAEVIERQFMSWYLERQTALSKQWRL